MLNKCEVSLESLKDFLPSKAFEYIIDYIHTYKIHLTITRNRKTVLGDYRHNSSTQHHRISINGNLNPYAFLITLLHELAHLLCFNNYGNKVQPHGKEWKHIYAKLLTEFIQYNIFPEDIVSVLIKSTHNPAASSCKEIELIKALSKYDKKLPNIKYVEDLPEGALFSISDGRIFKKGEKLRKRIKCILAKNGKLYLFSPIYEVKLMDS